MPSFRLSGKAKADIKRIARFTERRWGRVQRNHYLSELDRTFRQLAENHSIGTACDYIRPGYRKFPIGSHIIFYRTHDSNSVDIIRVIHKHMDVSAIPF
jgi:toxin ParE1/3/4